MGRGTYISFYLRNDSVHIFVDALRSIDNPKFVRFLFNTSEMKMIMQPYHKKEFITFRVPSGIYSEDTPYKPFRLRSKALCDILSSQMGWDKGLSYRVPGEIYSAQRIVRFDLNKASPILH